MATVRQGKRDVILHRYQRLVLAWTTGLICVAGTQLWAQRTGPETVDPVGPLGWLQQARLARNENSQKLRSAVGEGHIRHFEFARDQLEPTVLLDADFRLWYVAPRFQLLIRYADFKQNATRTTPPNAAPARNASGLSGKLIVYDGETVVAVETTAAGVSRGDIYFPFNRQNVLRTAGFPTDHPLELSSGFRVESTELESARVTPLVHGGLVGTLDRDTYRLKFYFLDQFGYDLRRFSSYRLKDNALFRDCVMTWQESNGVYYIQRFVSRLDQLGTSHIPRNRLQVEIEYNRFEANVPVDEGYFSISQWPVAAGTTFRDHRDHVGGQPRVLTFDGRDMRRSDE